MLFINPPFGNYLNLNDTISIKGSFTLLPRPGLITQIIKTLRYDFIRKAWINKIGLRNPGIDYAIDKYKNQNCIVSVAILKEDEIPTLLEKIPKNMNLELNVSCPNTDKKLIQKGLKDFLNPQRKWCIIKLSPLTDKVLIDNYYKEGFRQFHCCNTLPIKEGGLSGRSLMKFNEKLIPYIKNNFQDTVVIAGGGIQNMEDLKFYKNLGADHFSISTVCFNPFKLFKLL